ncbi:DUF551 domain-containing protein [Pseudomonas asiatica]|uniref:DUF551 domain-containing protein n=1 Tax=Pseudomonas asiatica TaxID=2219225 RepID=UPI002E7C0B05|nr:DUF551 domain-containing protein [Pseudomonas asiatica]MEE1914972.1 DUF551 domain-containing protein [Pseudomonas asiatica]
MSAWIKCSDRLPDLDQPVFLRADEVSGIGCRADIHDGNWGWAWALNPPIHDEAGWFVDGYELDDFEPTHWQPLPSPPNE